MTWPGLRLSPAERVFHGARALVTGGSTLLEYTISLRQQQAQWQAINGTSLEGKWVRIVRPGWPDRFVQQGTESGESGDEPPAGSEIVATFEADAHSRPLAQWLTHEIQQLPAEDAGSEFCERAQAALSGSRNREWLVGALGPQAQERQPPIAWPAEGTPPVDPLHDALTDYRLALIADGAVMGDLGTVIELYRLLIDRNRAGAELAAVAAPWREGMYDNSEHVRQATVHQAVDIGEGQAIFELFRTFSGQLSDGVAGGFDAGENDFYDWLFQLAPLAHASVVLGQQMLREPWMPATARDGVRGRLHTVEEFRVRILDGVTEHLDNLRYGGLAWRRRVDQLRDIAVREGHRAMQRRANKMCGQLMLYPPKYLEPLVAEVGNS